MKSTYIISGLFISTTFCLQAQDVFKQNSDSVKFQNPEKILPKNNFQPKMDSLQNQSSSLLNLTFDTKQILDEISTTQSSTTSIDNTPEFPEFKLPPLKLPKLSLYDSPNLNITGNHQNFQYALTDFNAVGTIINWHPNDKLSVVILPEAWKSYNYMNGVSSPDFYGSINVGLSYQVNDWLIINARAQRLINLNSPHIPPSLFRTDYVGVGAEFRVTNWLSMSVAANYVGCGGGMSVGGGAGFDLYKLYQTIKSIGKKKRNPIPEIWW